MLVAAFMTTSALDEAHAIERIHILNKREVHGKLRGYKVWLLILKKKTEGYKNKTAARGEQRVGEKNEWCTDSVRVCKRAGGVLGVHVDPRLEPLSQVARCRHEVGDVGVIVSRSRASRASRR